MNSRRLFSSGNFAKLSRTTRNTLHLYDSIGLLSPKTRGDNNYRYYSTEQLSSINLIRVLQRLGMTLNEINDLQRKRTPKFMDELLANQVECIDSKIREWVDAKKLLLTLQKTIHSALDADINQITIQFLPAEAVVMGDLNDYSRGKDDYTALLSFYNNIREKYPDIDLNYPVWARFSEARIKEGDWQWPCRYYFFNPEGYDKRPAALYAVGYINGGYGQTDRLYKRILDFIAQNNFEICGDAYEEYPLNEFSVSDEHNYLIRILVTVREKKGRADSV